MSKSVLISIQPKWCELIASGKKIIEVRKTKPKIDVPFKCYIYCSKQNTNNPHDILEIHSGGKIHKANGKVIGEFVCDGITPISVYYSDPNSHFALKEFPYVCMTDKEIIDYLGNGKRGYGWHISNLKIYDKPKELREFFVYCDRCDKRPIACKFAYEESNENGYYSECMCDFKRPIEKAPQSWCYVEKLKEG